MQTKVFLTGVVAVGCSFAAANADHPVDGMIGAVDDGNIVKRDDGDSSTYTRVPQWASTVAPEKLSSLHLDMQALATSVKANPLYSSMTAVLSTAIPQSFRDAVKNNPSSVHSKYKSTKPDWYMAMPSDVRSFMDANRQAAKSIFTKDIGPLPTHTGGSNAASTRSGSAIAAATGSSVGGKKASNEADSLRVAGAAVCALLGALGIAVMML